MPRYTRPAGEFALVAAGLIVAVFIIAASVATSVDHKVAEAVNRVGDPIISVRLTAD
jgi:hypothetical protein